MDSTTLIIVAVAAILVLVAILFLRRLNWGSSPGYTQLLPRQPMVRLDPSAERELRELLARGQKIEAIKRVRESTGISLKEAKDYVDSLPHISTVVAAEPPAEIRADTRSVAPEVERE